MANNLQLTTDFTIAEDPSFGEPELRLSHQFTDTADVYWDQKIRLDTDGQTVTVNPTFGAVNGWLLHNEGPGEAQVTYFGDASAVNDIEVTIPSGQYAISQEPRDDTTFTLAAVSSTADVLFLVWGDK